ncbi:cytochrome c oxidase assembly protein [Gordonia phthalatica]|uniref:Cytochrome c oxidase assembly protein n=1 Tax=Gordonia phthalatica TaxID=1136941 RepID=A0A0N9N0S2_9ACTN|nr:cytochrome c oxidase assembly protein [Gordonia phthalatica]ALG83697.1 hypothetical protein ACH46_03220 [Gordonia phthalatica]
MPPAELTVHTALTSWRFDPVSTVLCLVCVVSYLAAARGGRVGRGTRAAFVAGCAAWWFTANGFIAVYGDVLFWVRALGFVLLTLVAGFLLAAGRPVTVAVAHRRLRRAALRAGRSWGARWLLSPLATSMLMLVTPWLLFLTPWYSATVESAVAQRATESLLVAVGTVYFYARLQADPVPRHRHAGLSLVIATAETLGDGVLGVVLWQGWVLDAVVRQAMLRDWGPSPRTDQTVGAGILWVLGDVVGLPFLMYLFARWRADDDRSARAADVALTSPAEPTDGVATDRPWFLDDPELSERFHRR